MIKIIDHIVSNAAFAASQTNIRLSVDLMASLIKANATCNKLLAISD